MSRALILTALTASLLGLACDSGGGSSCNTLGCTADGLVIDFTDGGGGVAGAGHYKITALAVPDGAQQCEFDLPSSGTDPACRVGASRVVFNGFAPSEVTIIVVRDGGPLSSEEYTPTYTTTRPNGDGCGPVCSAGTLSIPAP